MKYYLFLLATSLTITSCQPVAHTEGDEETKLDKLSWMLGKWQMQTPEGVITEEWEKPSDTQWQGISYMITTQGDTPFTEKIRLNYTNDTLYYMPTVSGQNEGKEVSFTEKSLSDRLIVFENLRHEFPQRIIYERTSDSTITATIEGSENGQERREQFAYRRR